VILKGNNIQAVEIVVALLVSVVAGIVASTGEYIYILLLIATVTALFIAISPVALLFSVIIVGIVFAGLFRTYLPQLELIRWVVLPCSVLLILHAIYSEKVNPEGYKRNKLPGIIWWLFAFLVVIIISSIINNIDFQSNLAAYKGYLQAWGLLFALAYINYDNKTIEYIPKLFLAIAFLQLPFVLQQYFVLAPSRVGLAKGVVPIDVVSGTFGVSQFGGNNALLSAYLYICIAGCIALWQEKVWKTSSTLIVCALLLIPTLINEAKIGLIFLISIFLVLSFKYLYSSVNSFISSVLVFFVIVSVLLWSFVANVHRQDIVDSPKDLLKYTYEQNIEEDLAWDGKLTRVGALRYWLEKHGIENIGNTLIGHGPGVTRGLMGQNDKFIIGRDVNPALGIGNTAFSAVLWETGIIGLACVLGMFFSGFISSVRMANKCASSKKDRAIFRGISAGLAVLFVSFMSKSYFVYQVGYQTILFVLLGYLLYCEKFCTEDKSHVVEEEKTIK
jgi:hypothetical protein